MNWNDMGKAMSPQEIIHSKIKDVRRFEETLCRVTVENWKDCVRHSECLQEEDFIKEGIRDEVIQRFVINLQDESDTSSSETEKEI